MIAPMTPADHDPEALRARLDRAILRAQPEFDSVEVSQRAGVEPDLARRLWRALGFPDAGGEAVFTEADVDAVRKMSGAAEQGLDLDTLVRMTRAVGTTMSRLADWEIGNLIGAFDLTNPTPAELTERLRAAAALVEQINPLFEELLVYSWRRHLVAAVARAEALVPEVDETEVVTTVGFADLVSFTSTTNALDEDEIGDLVEIFESRCADVVSARRGRVIKSLGDSVLFVADRAEDAVHIAWDIVSVIGGDHRLPDVRVGIATGPSVFRMGDVYGPSVNLAARLTQVARRNRVIIDRATGAALPAETFELRVLPARAMRGFGDIEPVAVRRTR